MGPNPLFFGTAILIKGFIFRNSMSKKNEIIYIKRIRCFLLVRKKREREDIAKTEIER